MVSIIVPIFNAEKYLARCLDSLLKQTLSDIEIIAVDDGSTDGSPLILDSYASRDARIKAIHVENGGVSKARNLGLEQVQGQFVGFVDSDDWAESNMFEILYNNAQEYNADISICGVFGESSDGEPVVLSGKQAKICMYSPDCFHGYSVNKLVRRNLLFKAKYDENLKCYEDLVLFHQLFSECGKVVWQSTPLYHYEKNEASATSDYRLTQAKLDGLSSLRNLLDQETDKDICDAMEDYFFRYNLETAIDYISHCDVDSEGYRYALEGLAGSRERIKGCTLRQRAWMHIIQSDRLKRMYWFIKGKGKRDE